MPHYHLCKVCQIQVANCSDDSCLGEDHANAGEHYCSIHHPDEKIRVEVVAPPSKAKK
jgi:hypothetical protein